MAHLVAPIGIERLLHGDDRRHAAGVMIPTMGRMVLSRILPQACRGILFRIDGDRHQMDLIARGAEILLKLLEDLTTQGTDRGATGLDEIQHDRSAVIEFGRQRDGLAVIPEMLNVSSALSRISCICNHY